MSDQEKYAKRIADLLKIAERGDDAEAEAAQEMAERLMARYGIERAVAEAKGDHRGENIIEKVMKVDGIYAKAMVMGFHRVGAELNVKVLQSNVPGSKMVVAYLIGYESDVDSAETLFTSLMLQSLTSATKAFKADTLVQYGTAAQKFNFRRSHVVGFFHGAASRIHNAKRQVFTETTGSELVVRDRMQAVDTWVQDTYGKLRKGRGMGLNYGYEDGVTAGRNAMTGESQLKQKGQIGG